MSELSPFAGLQVNLPGEPLATNNYGFYANTMVIDHYLQAFVEHRHDGSPAVVQFDDPPTVTASAEGGSLLPGDTWWIGITAVDQYGGETVATKASATVPGAIINPTVAPTLTVYNDGLGLATSGTYRYAYTIVAGSGESLPSPVANATRATDGRILVVPPGAPAQWRLYRSYGFGSLWRVGETMTASSFIDDGATGMHCDQGPPSENTTNAIGSIEITRPDLPASAVGWRAYASRSISLPQSSLLSFDSGATTLITASSTVYYTDSGQIKRGAPPTVNRTIPGAAPILASEVAYAGSDNLASGSVEEALDSLSALANGGVVTVNYASGDIMLLAGSAIAIDQPSASAAAITIHNTGVRSIAASGGTALTGPVVVTGSGSIVVGASAGVMTITGLTPPAGTTVGASGDVGMTGDVKFVAGTGVAITQATGASALTIAVTGSGPASAGVNSLALGGGSLKQGDIKMSVVGSGFAIAETASGFSFENTGVTGIQFYEQWNTTGGAYSGAVRFDHTHTFDPVSSAITIDVPSALDDLTDVTAAAPANGDRLTYDAGASAWVASGTAVATVYGYENHTWAVGSTIAVASGETDVLPAAKVTVRANETVKLTKVDYKHTTAAASATFGVQLNGAGATGFTGLVANSSWQTTDPTDVDLADGDVLQPVVASVSGGPKNLSVTITIERLRTVT